MVLFTGLHICLIFRLAKNDLALTLIRTLAYVYFRFLYALGSNAHIRPAYYPGLKPTTSWK
jgi:hypothetical protein